MGQLELLVEVAARLVQELVKYFEIIQTVSKSGNILKNRNSTINGFRCTVDAPICYIYRCSIGSNTNSHALAGLILAHCNDAPAILYFEHSLRLLNHELKQHFGGLAFDVAAHLVDASYGHSHLTLYQTDIFLLSRPTVSSNTYTDYDHRDSFLHTFHTCSILPATTGAEGGAFCTAGACGFLPGAAGVTAPLQHYKSTTQHTQILYYLISILQCIKSAIMKKIKIYWNVLMAWFVFMLS